MAEDSTLDPTGVIKYSVCVPEDYSLDQWLPTFFGFWHSITTKKVLWHPVQSKSFRL